MSKTTSLRTCEAYRRKYSRDYARKYRAEHPDAILKTRLRAAAKLLMAHGWTVSAPADREAEIE